MLEWIRSFVAKVVCCTCFWCSYDPSHRPVISDPVSLPARPREVYHQDEVLGSHSFPSLDVTSNQETPSGTDPADYSRDSEAASSSDQENHRVLLQGDPPAAQSDNAHHEISCLQQVPEAHASLHNRLSEERQKELDSLLSVYRPVWTLKQALERLQCEIRKKGQECDDINLERRIAILRRCIRGEFLGPFDPYCSIEEVFDALAQVYSHRRYVNSCPQAALMSARLYMKWSHERPEFVPLAYQAFKYAVAYRSMTGMLGASRCLNDHPELDRELSSRDYAGMMQEESRHRNAVQAMSLKAYGRIERLYR